MVPLIRSLIETGGYGRSINAEGDAALDFAAYLYITQPLASVENSESDTTLVDKLVQNLSVFNQYWTYWGANASLFGQQTNIDAPPVTASYIYGDIVNAEAQQQVKAPEMNANGAAGALTLLFGAMFVLLGRRSSAVNRSPSTLP